MGEGDFLCELIKALDEKEYKFILEFAKGTRGKATQRESMLIDFRRQKEYNAQLLKPKYRNFEVLKFQVKQMVLQALRIYHEDDTIDQKIDVHLNNERILYKKGMYNQAAKELDFSQKLAEQYQKLGRLLEILQLKQFRLVERQTKDLHPLVVANFQCIETTLEAYRIQIVAFRKYQELFAAYRTEGKSHGAGATPIPSTDPIPNDFYAKLYENACNSLGAQLRGDLKEAILLAEQAVALFESHPEIRDELQLNYKIQLANLGVLLVGGGRYAEVADIIKRLKKIESRDFNEEAETFQNTIHLELLLMVNIRDFDGQANLIQRVEDGLELYGGKINAARKLSIWYNLLILYIINENFKSAKTMVERIVGHKKFQVRKEIQYTTRLLELLIYFELEIWDLPDHTITAVRRYLERKDQLTEFKINVLRFVQMLAGTPLEERTETFRQLEHALHEIASDQNNQDSLGLAVVAAWTCSKHEKKSLKECLQ